MLIVFTIFLYSPTSIIIPSLINIKYGRYQRRQVQPDGVSKWLKGLSGAKLVIGDKCLGMVESIGDVYPDAKYQRYVVHFYRNIFSVVPLSKMKSVAKK